MAPHPELGWAMAPGDRHSTYDLPVQLNALGFRGPEVGAKAATEYRIVALGDSHVYGQGITDADLATTVIERHYRQPPSSCDVRVVNLGVRAYSINQEYAVLRMLGRTLAPDLVLLFFYLNDFELVDVQRRWERFKRLERDRRGTLRLIAAPDGHDGSVTVHQDVRLSSSVLQPGEKVAYTLARGRFAWLHVARGVVTLNGQTLAQGDGAAVSDEPSLNIAATAPSDILLFDLA